MEHNNASKMSVCVCMCVSGLEIIYIQVAYLTAPVVPHLLIQIQPYTYPAFTHLVFVQYLFITLILDGLYTMVAFSSCSFAHWPLLGPLFLPIMHSHTITIIISLLLVKPWKVSVCLWFMALSFLCESDRRSLSGVSLCTCAKHVMLLWFR